MISYNRTYCHAQTKKLLSETNKKTLKNSRVPLTKDMENYQQIQCMKQIIRQHQVKNLQLRNQILKKQIEAKEKLQKMKQAENELARFRKQRQVFSRAKKMFENQRKQSSQKICMLQLHLQEIKDKAENAEPPKDRYQTCMRELDELKMCIQQQQSLVKQRDFYKYLYQQIRQLVLQGECKEGELKNNLIILIEQVDSKKDRVS